MIREQPSTTVAVLAGIFFCGLVITARCDTTNLLPTADTALLQSNPGFNSGSHSNFAAGTMATGAVSRALIEFSPGATIPPGSTINAVTLTLTVTSPGTVGSNFELHRVLADWGEGTKTGQQGALASPNEATWNDRLAGSQPWVTPGAAAPNDFSSLISAATPVAGLGSYMFASTPALVADVQSWLDNPASNFGWILLSASESTSGTARRFASREDVLGRGPLLQIDYTPVPEPGVIALIAAGLAAFGAARLRPAKR